MTSLVDFLRHPIESTWGHRIERTARGTIVGEETTTPTFMLALAPYPGKLPQVTTILQPRVALPDAQTGEIRAPLSSAARRQFERGEIGYGQCVDVTYQAREHLDGSVTSYKITNIQQPQP